MHSFTKDNSTLFNNHNMIVLDKTIKVKYM